jgi:hypothetical protein
LRSQQSEEASGDEEVADDDRFITVSLSVQQPKVCGQSTHWSSESVHAVVHGRTVDEGYMSSSPRDGE